MINRYSAMFERCRAANEGALGAFVMLGDPRMDDTNAYLDALVEGGADMIELGIPFSDPVADGPVIQAAAERALAAGVRTLHCLRLIHHVRQRHADVPLGVLTYANIVAAKGTRQFCETLAEAGADSLLVADVPSIEAEPYAEAARRAGIDLVMIAATNTPRATIRRIAATASGYTYCVARAGVTGADSAPRLDHSALFSALEAEGAPPPVLGFGISTPSQVAEAIDSGAAGAISGSAIVHRISEGASPADIARFVGSLKAATRRPSSPRIPQIPGFVQQAES